jgi:serine/threonine protein phosphatase 1
MSISGGRRIVIGDVHGHYDGLMRLFDAIAPSASDSVYFLGDLIDRGPKSCQVVEFVKQSGHVSLLGNHEQLLLDAFPGNRIHPQAMQAWIYSGGQATLSSYTSIDTLLEHINWIQTLPSHLDLGDVWLVHAGVHPELTLQEQTLQEYCWIREKFHSIETPYFKDKLIITGHTITFTLPEVNPGAIAQGAGWIDIDTGAYHPKSGWLTALDITNQLVYQVNMFQPLQRKLPFIEAVNTVEPAKVVHRRRQMMQFQT